jgi:hypothetical protein
MNEVSNTVKVLIARMESHPDDFARWGKRAKFADTADALDSLAGLDDEIKAPFWFLNDTDKQALLEAWKKLNYARWEKETMERVFDEGYYERMDQIEMQKQQYQQQMQQARMAQQNQMLSGSLSITPLHNGSLLSQAGSSTQGLTVSANGAVNMANTLSLGGETLDSSILKKLKDLVK